jgi:hypothetical protein
MLMNTPLCPAFECWNPCAVGITLCLDHDIILQHPAALCILTSCSHFLPSLYSVFLHILIFTLQHVRLFSLYNATCFGRTDHHQVYKILEYRNLMLCYHTVLLYISMQNASKIFYFRLFRLSCRCYARARCICNMQWVIHISVLFIR